MFSGGAITEYALTSLARLISTSEPYLPLIAVLGVVGLLSSVQHRLLVLPAWWAATILLDVRAFPTFTTIPVAMLAGMAVSDVVLPMLDRGRHELGADRRRPVLERCGRREWRQWQNGAE